MRRCPAQVSQQGRVMSLGASRQVEAGGAASPLEKDSYVVNKHTVGSKWRGCEASIGGDRGVQPGSAFKLGTRDQACRLF